jgi:hypothetical protein
MSRTAFCNRCRRGRPTITALEHILSRPHGAHEAHEPHTPHEYVFGDRPKARPRRTGLRPVPVKRKVFGKGKPFRELLVVRIQAEGPPYTRERQKTTKKTLRSAPPSLSFYDYPVAQLDTTHLTNHLASRAVRIRNHLKMSLLTTYGTCPQLASSPARQLASSPARQLASSPARQRVFAPMV